MPTRYFFDLFNKSASIPDEGGIELADFEAAIAAALEAIAELREADPSSADAWHGWRLEIAEESGRVVRTIFL
jgi:hypothetical protein